MKGGALEQRRFPRVALAPLASRADAYPGRPVLVNVSGGGACVWLHEPPFVLSHGSFFLYLQSSVRKLLLRARLVWLRPFEPSTEGDGGALPPGWLAGLAFAPGQAAVSSDEAFGDNLEVDLLPAHGARSQRPNTLERDDEPTLGVGHALARFQAAAESLLPVLARHFSDVRFVLTRDRLELSAPLRPIEEPETGKQGARTVEPEEARHEAPTARNPTQPARAARSPGAAGRDGANARPAARASGFRWVLVLLIPVVVAAFAALNRFGVFSARHDAAVAPRTVASQEQPRPVWAREVQPSDLAGWVAIRERFGLSDAAIRSAIHALKANDRYAPGHAFRDLTAYPTQVERAFAILADRKASASYELDALKEELQGRLASGARFPDEAPGSRYFSNLDPRLYDNTIVLAVVELLYRHRADPDASHLLTALAGS